jgi:putative alpha-1,2-mannosidase
MLESKYVPSAVVCRVGISFISEAQALLNLQTEALSTTSFDTIYASTAQIWEDAYRS